MAITWKNLNAQSNAAANALAVAGGNQIQEGIQGLAKLASRQGDIITANQANTTKNNTQAVLERIQSLGSITDYNQAIETGEFSGAALREQFGESIDTAAVRDALLNQDNNIRKEETEKYNYDSMVTERTEKPMIREFSALIAGAQTAEQIDQVRSQVAGSELTNTAPLLAALNNRQSQIRQNQLSDISFEVKQMDLNDKRRDLYLDKAYGNVVNEAIDQFPDDPNAGRGYVTQWAKDTGLSATETNQALEMFNVNSTLNSPELTASQRATIEGIRFVADNDKTDAIAQADRQLQQVYADNPIATYKDYDENTSIGDVTSFIQTAVNDYTDRTGDDINIGNPVDQANEKFTEFNTKHKGQVPAVVMQEAFKRVGITNNVFDEFDEARFAQELPRAYNEWLVYRKNVETRRDAEKANADAKKAAQLAYIGTIQGAASLYLDENKLSRTKGKYHSEVNNANR